jgi:hypothetical protein
MQIAIDKFSTIHNNQLPKIHTYVHEFAHMSISVPFFFKNKIYTFEFQKVPKILGISMHDPYMRAKLQNSLCCGL